MAQNVARLGVILGLDAAEFHKALKSAKQSLKELGDFAVNASKIGAVAFAAMTAKAIQMSDEMADLAKANDMTIGTIVNLGSSLEQSGGKADAVGKILASFTNKVDEAAQGGLAAQKSFARIGITLQDLGKLSGEDLFAKTLDQLAKIPESITRNALAFELLGKGIKGTDIKELNEQLQKGKGQYDKYAAAIENAAQLNDLLESKAKKLALTFTNNVMPAVVELMTYITKEGGTAEFIFEKLGKAVIYFYAGLAEAGDAMSSLSAKFTAIKEGDFAGSEGKYLNAMNEIALGKLKRYERINELLKNEQKQQPTKDPFTGRQVTAAKDPEVDKQKEMLRVASIIGDEYKRQQAFSLQQLAIRGQMEGMTSNERTIQEAINQQLDATSKKLDEITKKREDAAGRGANAKTLAEYDKQFRDVQQFSQEYITAAKIISQSTIETQRTFTYGWDKAFAQYAEDAGNYGKLAQDMFSSFTNNMNSAIDNFVENGKLSFSDFAVSVIKDLLKIEMRMQASQLLSAGLKFATGLISGGGATANVTDYSTPYAFAEGGSPPVGVPSLVGERGPELFVPSRAGTIIPNNQLSNLGGTTNVTNNYIDAIDTKSFEDRLYGSSKAVWAANQYGNKNISTSRMRT